ncbi:hypothetical protein C0995_001673 [Termitomyces sp. Mi166|nr:hypothetical protein C0995_001673 [Termitomyces sp. Mi166\
MDLLRTRTTDMQILKRRAPHLFPEYPGRRSRVRNSRSRRSCACDTISHPKSPLSKVTYEEDAPAGMGIPTHRFLMQTNFSVESIEEMEPILKEFKRFEQETEVAKLKNTKQGGGGGDREPEEQSMDGERLDFDIAVADPMTLSNKEYVQTASDNDIEESEFSDGFHCSHKDPIAWFKSILQDRKLYRRLLRFKTADTQKVLDSLQQLLDVPELDSRIRKDFIVALQRISTKTRLYPTCYELEGVEQIGQYPVSAGGFADIYKASLPCRALLGDFGISSVSDTDIIAWTSQTKGVSKGGSVRWQASELFIVGDNDDEEPEAPKKTLASDYIFTGKVPFAYLPNDFNVMLQVQSGVHPKRPPISDLSWTDWGLTEEIWLFMERCWNQDPSHRPPSVAILQLLTLPNMEDIRPSSNTHRLSAVDFRRQMNKSLDIMTAEALNSTLQSSSDLDTDEEKIEDLQIAIP